MRENLIEVDTKMEEGEGEKITNKKEERKIYRGHEAIREKVFERERK